jgi:DNA invertase Pin-like site-specific DNA recombinase
MTMETKRVGIYCRVSTKEQTTENQLLDLRKYCQVRGWEIVAECVDNGISGAKDDRPALHQVMGLARKRKIDTLLVWRFDRLARSLSHLVNTLEELRGRGVDFVSYQEALDTSTPQGRMVFGVVASLAEFERALIVDRVRSGIRRAQAQGKQLGRPKAAVDLAQMHRLRLDGRSMREIASALSLGKGTVERALRLSQKGQPKSPKVSVEAAA